jgi:hypothetical protein
MQEVRDSAHRRTRSAYCCNYLFYHTSSEKEPRLKNGITGITGGRKRHPDEA